MYAALSWILQPNPENVSEQMRSDWNDRAKEDAHYYVAFGAREQDEAAFLATASEVVRGLESELKHFGASGATSRMTALEIGCGPGRLMKPMSRHFARIHGVDVSDEMIRLARERLKNIPNAHVEATNGATLSQFADESLDFIYSYAVFQHIPSRDVVLSYMREARRVLKPGGIFRAQFNNLPHDQMPNTWSGVTFSVDDLKTFTRENGFRILALEGIGTQYLWTTWQRKNLPIIRYIRSAFNSDTLLPAHGRYAIASILVVDLPDEIDLNNLEVFFDGQPGIPYYIGPPQPGNLRQINVRLPNGLRTGLIPVETCGTKKHIRVLPPGPMVPHIISVSDGINLVQHNHITTGLVKVIVEEISDPSTISVTIDSSPGKGLEWKCTDPVPPRYELNFSIPDSLAPGSHVLRVDPVKTPVAITISPASY